MRWNLVDGQTSDDAMHLAVHPSDEKIFLLPAVRIGNSPPASGSQSVGVQPAHVTHTNQPHDEVFHPFRDPVLGVLCSSHGDGEEKGRENALAEAS